VTAQLWKTNFWKQKDGIDSCKAKIVESPSCHQIGIIIEHCFWIDKSLNKRKKETIEGMKEVNLNKHKNKK